MFKFYAANEVRGDKTYKNKKVLISGVVKKYHLRSGMLLSLVLKPQKIRVLSYPGTIKNNRKAHIRFLSVYAAVNDESPGRGLFFSNSLLFSV